MRRIDLVFFTGCPHVQEARRRLRCALIDAAHPPQWHEWDVAQAQTPDAYRGYGSPSVLVDGRDVAGEVRGSGVSCVATGAPTPEQLAAALAEGVG